jgi:cephalosporin-C deacetylase
MAKKKKEITFDDCTSYFPEVEPPAGMQDYWSKAIKDLQVLPLNPRTKLIFKKSLGWEIHYQVFFQGAAGKTVSGSLAIPRIKRNRPAVLILPDINQQPPGSRPFTDAGLAHLTLDPAEFSVHGFDPQKLHENNSIYHYYINAVRAVDFLAQYKGNHAGKIAIFGSGIGGAAAAFAAYHRPDNVKVLALEKSGSLCLNNWLENSKNQYASDLRLAMEGSVPRIKQKMDEALALLDPVYLAESIKQPAFVSCLMTDERNPPMGIFGFFNHLQTEKYMDLYMNESNDPHSVAQRKKALQFFIEKLTGQGPAS